MFDFPVDDIAAGARILPALHTALVKVVTVAFVIKGGHVKMTYKPNRAH